MLWENRTFGKYYKYFGCAIYILNHEHYTFCCYGRDALFPPCGQVKLFPLESYDSFEICLHVI